MYSQTRSARSYSLMPKRNECGASVKQVGEDFQPGLSSHNHPADGFLTRLLQRK